MLHLSPYNVVIPQGEEVLLFNTHSLHFGRLKASLFDEAVNLVAALNSDPGKLPPGEEVKRSAFELRNRGFFVSDPDEERHIVMSRFDKQRIGRHHLGLTIAPTDSCNFACPYCYENLNYTTMSIEMQRRVAAFIESSLATDKYRSMHITWYGGEPLTPKGLQAIEFISERIIDICSKRNVSYSANIISNGYLLNRSVAQRLTRAQVGLMQVTLDGPRELHNRTRVLKNGTGTFDRILENIKSCSDLLRFSIRMNVTAENAASIGELKRVLRDEGILNDPARTTFYVSPVRSYTASCQGSTCMSNESFYRLQLDLLKTGINDDGVQVVEDYPIAKESVCTAVGPDSFVIGPNGDLYKCWLDIGRHELAVGRVSEGTIDLNENIGKWHNFQPFNATSCASCTMLPICMGGCPALNMRSAGEEENQACCNWKYHLHDHLVYLAEQDNNRGSLQL